MQEAIFAFSIINSTVIFIFLIILFICCCCSKEGCVITIFILIKIILTFIEWGISLGIIGETKAITKKFKYNASLNTIDYRFTAVTGLLSSILFLNIIELIVSLCCINDCHCYCDCDCCKKRGNIYNGLVHQTIESNTERNTERKTERKTERNTEMQSVTVVHKRTIVVSDGNNVLVQNRTR